MPASRIILVNRGSSERMRAERSSGVLGDISLEAIRIATLQLAVKKLEEGLRLLAQAGIQREQGVTFTAPQAAAPPAVKNPCVLCGRPGVYQSKNSAIPPAKRPFYCEGDHATWARSEDNEERAVRAVMPPGAQAQVQPPAPVAAPVEAPAKPAGLAAAMASLRGESA